MSLMERLADYARELGIDLVGVTTAQPFTTALNVLKERKRRGLYAPLAPPDLERVCIPELVLPGARSIIAVGMSYYQGDLPVQGGYRGFLSRCAWGQDYHRVVRSRLHLLQEFLAKEVPGAEFVPFVDTGPLLDKEVAWRAGLGWFGKNTLLLTAFGSWVFLGGILTTVELPPHLPWEAGCGDCEQCLRACPTGALVAPGVLDYSRCLAYLTQQKGYLPRRLRPALGVRLYGCDTCQEVCPHNRRVSITGHREFFPAGDEHRPDLLALLRMSSRKFKAQFGATSAGWRGRTVLVRNALVALGNIGDEAVVPELVPFLQDPRPVIRGHAAWALGRLGDSWARRALERAALRESDPEVQREIGLALEES